MRLIVQLRQQNILISVVHRGSLIKTASILRREMPLEMLRQKVQQFLKGIKVHETFLLLKRSDVLQKEFELASGGNETHRQSFETQLRDVMPCALDEMAYSFRCETGKGLIYAVPEAGLREDLAFLEKIGMPPDDIFTEDQPLTWLLLETTRTEPALLLHLQAGEVLGLFVKGGQLVFSRSFKLQQDLDEVHLKDFLHDLSISLMESNQGPNQVFLSGHWQQAFEIQISRHFDLPLSVLGETQSKTPQERLLAGLKFFQKYKPMSLLPKAEKLQKWNQQRKKELKQVLMFLSVFCCLVSLSFLMHVNHLEEKSKSLSEEIRRIKPQVERLQKMENDLLTIGKAQASKKQTLDFLKELSLKLPESIHFREIKVDKNNFFLKGESPNHATLTETMGVLENLSQLENVKLEHTRMRKRLNRDFFEFEVIGTWKI